MIAHRFSLLVLVSLTLFVRISGAVDYPNTDAGAKALLAEFVKPGADTKALTKPLRPAAADYDAVYGATVGAKLRAAYDPMWESGAAVIGPKAGQTELLVDGVPSSEIKQWTKRASNILPGGYQQLAADIKEGLTIYRFKFVAPGETLGMAFDGLVFVNGHWCLIPKPWRALEAK